VKAAHTPAWLRAAVDQRLALMDQGIGIKAMASMSGSEIVFTFLTEPAEGAGSLEVQYWEHACDNCGKYDKVDVTTGTVVLAHNGVNVVVQFGACSACRAAA
jgi:hypothetical protein